MLISGALSQVTALANNMILFPTVGLKTIKFFENYIEFRDGRVTKGS
jgi:hypothetical protein